MRQLTVLLIALTFTGFMLLSCGDSGTGPDPGNGGNGNGGGNGSNGGNETPTYTVDVSAADGGSVSPSGSNSYEEGETVELQAEANDEYLFSEWTGDLESSDNPVSLTVDQDYSVTANFAKKTYELTTSTDGEGAISEKVVQEKSTDYEHGTVVELTANPADGWKFVEWQGDVTGTDNPQQVTVDSPKEVTAVFEKKSYALTTNTDGEGAIAEEVVQQNKDYEHGTVVELTANPATGWKFAEWQGDLTGTGNPREITIDQAKEVTAVFEKKSYALNINTTGNGSVTKSPDQTTYEYGTSVELEATPASGYQFVEWTGTIVSTNNPVQVTIEEEAQVTASFEEKPSFYLASNGVTVKCEDASVGDTGTVNGVTYTKRSEDQITVSNAETSCTSGITDMSGMFTGDDAFNGDISSWDVSSVTNMSSMFFDATSFSGDISSWDVSNVTDMSEMFYEATAFNGDISSWDVSSVTDMSSMFERNDTFNQDLNSWNVSSVTDMSGMFSEAAAFNGDISSWNVSSVIEMGEMFSEATSFNIDIGDWNVGNVTDMGDMFFSATSFNKDLGWDVSSVTDMRSMFAEATSFNGNISGWDVSSVDFMSSMFENADAFNGTIGSWDVSNVTSMHSMFQNAASFNQDISSWCVSNFDSEPSNFSDGSPLQESYKPEWGTCPGS